MLIWWRVELSPEGKVLAVKPVDAEERGSKYIRFILSADGAEACASAVAWLERRRVSQSASAKRREAERRKRGQCRSCSKRVDSGSVKYCAAHLKRQRELYHERKDGKRPASSPTTPKQAEAIKARIEFNRRRWQRQRVGLTTILEWFDSLDGRLDSPFREWCINEISARTGGLARAAE